LHKYLYTSDDPVNRRDPSGNEADLNEEAVTLEISADLAIGTADTVPGVALADTAVANGIAAEAAPALAVADTVPIAAAETGAASVGGGAGAGAATVAAPASAQALWVAEEFARTLAARDALLVAGNVAAYTAWARWIFAESDFLFNNIWPF
jgi:hypothetical protein